VFRKAAVLLLLAAATPGCVPRPALLPSTEAVIADVRFLANYNLEGRATGSRGSDRAATFIMQRYKTLGVSGAFPALCYGDALHCDAEFFQSFTVAQGRAKNVGALIPGTDSVLRNKYVVVGAHYDHIGHSPYLSLDPEAGDATRPGADDNASGTLGLKPRYSTEIEARSDHASFRSGGVPAIALFTGFHSDYHRVTDVPRKIDARGIEQIADLTEGVLRAVADR